VSWSEVYCSCIECNVWNAWMVGVVVVGGVFISLNHQTTVGGGCCRWTHRTGIVQCPVRLWRAALTLRTLFFTVHLILQLLQPTVARRNRCSAVTPDSLVNYSGARPEKPESGEFEIVRSWCTGQPGAPDQGTLGFFAPLYLNPIFNLLLVCVEPLCTCRTDNLEQTS
jgi:hypothetical protein